MAKTVEVGSPSHIFGRDRVFNEGLEQEGCVPCFTVHTESLDTSTGLHDVLGPLVGPTGGSLVGLPPGLLHMWHLSKMRHVSNVLSSPEQHATSCPVSHWSWPSAVQAEEGVGPLVVGAVGGHVQYGTVGDALGIVQ